MKKEYILIGMSVMTNIEEIQDIFNPFGKIISKDKREGFYKVKFGNVIRTIHHNGLM